MRVNVSKGALRFCKMRSQKLAHAVPTLDLRRKQLTRETINWEEKIRELEAHRDILASKMQRSPHPEVEKIVLVSEIKTLPLNIAGVLLEELEEVRFDIAPYSFFASSPSLDIFVSLKKELLKVEKGIEVMTRSLDVLLDELAVTTQRINLFEKRLIPRYDEQIRYIRGRLEDNERTNVMIAKIAQKEILQQAHTSETA
ncbi:MAG: V-type ATP synthase subunit D [Pseudomonadota bacterium]